MPKQVVAVTEAARNAGMVAKNLAGRILALQTEAKRIDADETERRGHSLQLVASKTDVSILIKTGKTKIQIEGDEFAITHG